MDASNFPKITTNPDHHISDLENKNLILEEKLKKLSNELFYYKSLNENAQKVNNNTYHNDFENNTMNHQTNYRNTMNTNNAHNHFDNEQKYHNEIADLNYRLQIAINQIQELKESHFKELDYQNTFYNNEILKLTTKNNSLEEENQKLKSDLESLSQKYSVEMSFIQNQDRFLLLAAEKYFHLEFQKVEDVTYFFTNNVPFHSILHEKDQIIENNLKIIISLKKKNHFLKKIIEEIDENHHTEIIHLKHKIKTQESLNNGLKTKIEDQANEYQDNMMYLLQKITHELKPKHENSNADQKPNQIVNQNENQGNPKTDYLMKASPIKCEYSIQNHVDSNLVKQLNEMISKLHEDNHNLNEKITKYKIKNKKLKSAVKSKENKIMKLNSKINSLKFEFDRNINNTSKAISNLSNLNKIPDQITEKVIAAAKNKIHQQREKLKKKVHQIHQMENHIKDLRLQISEQNIHLNAHFSNMNSNVTSNMNIHKMNDSESLSESSESFHFSDSFQNKQLLHEQQNPEIIVFNYNEYSPKLQPILRPILENNSLSFETKINLSIRKIVNYFVQKIEKNKKFKSIVQSINCFISDVTSLIVNKNIPLESLYKDIDSQAQIIATLKENQRKIIDSQNNSLKLVNEKKKLERKIVKLKESSKKDLNTIKSLETIKNEKESLSSEKNQLHIQNLNLFKNCEILKAENTELKTSLETEKNISIKMKKEYCQKIREYEKILQKLKDKCYKQQIKMEVSNAMS
ncbi:hypothetical protein TRFO_18328 [Tritrichomonas foetus]|uniref:Uncharacterized protein n=1 Tax=Tritrichomonas foetus TaxID=1144522 RepID=A0A1J4KR61_9EUKA|nr:hypothetical protein TRFO_18328 [Tritrichomonas foetus]|eukprot:OHT11957.1 hypothetical protein TRFO_18328 [Tritrichomonas foetus]